MRINQVDDQVRLQACGLSPPANTEKSGDRKKHAEHLRLLSSNDLFHRVYGHNESESKVLPTKGKYVMHSSAVSPARFAVGLLEVCLPTKKPSLQQRPSNCSRSGASHRGRAQRRRTSVSSSKPECRAHCRCQYRRRSTNRSSSSSE